MTKYVVTTTADKPLIPGQWIRGARAGRTRKGRLAFVSAWEGVYMGVRASDVDEPIHLFRDGHVSGVPQRYHGFPASELPD